MVREIQFNSFSWVDILRSPNDDLDAIAQKYNLNPYQITDSEERGHLPKFEKGDVYDFLILRAFTGNEQSRITNIQELSSKIAFFYNDNFIITIHREDFKFLNHLKNKQYADSQGLLLSIIYEMIETFRQPSIELSDKADEFEKMIFLKHSSEISLEDLYYEKSQTRITKKLLQITQNVINSLEISKKYKSALQDIKDSILDLGLRYDEVLEDSYNLLNTYLSVNSQRSNDVMKLLTIFSAFFLPLTFIAGIYGMNFENMPELKWKMGYFLTLLLMAFISLVIYIWFKKKKII